VLLLAATLCAAPAFAATIVIVNADTTGEGFHDPTPVAPIGGNPGVTLGAQRLNVFQEAADIWGAILPSAVTIRVQASFDPQTCSPTGAVLGSAGPQTVHRDFGGAEFAGTWYHQALANKQAGSDLSANDDIRARFNRSVDDGVCLGATDWYYGFDGNEGGDVELLPVVLHELGHGLGFSTLVNLSTGALFNGVTDLYARFLYDDQTLEHWNVMTNAERQASAIHTGRVVWDGFAVTARAPLTLAPRPEVVVHVPPAIAGAYAAGAATFGPPLTSGGVTADVVQAVDGSGTSSDACSGLVNGAAIAGRIALVDRGTCGFVTKAANVQAAGAVGMLLVNDVAGAPPSMGGSGSISIPSASVSQADGNAIRAQLGAGVHATLRVSPSRLAGANDDGQVMIYAPNPIESGSSISHFDVSASPNLLMEPAINADLSRAVDLTRYAFEDLGWLPRTTSVPGGPVPSGLALRAPAPNPSAAATAIGFALSRPGLAELAVFDLAGRRVASLARTWLPAGDHTLVWNGRDASGRRVPAGVYVCALGSNGERATRRLVRVD
jgi:hypothetical protein